MLIQNEGGSAPAPEVPVTPEVPAEPVVETPVTPEPEKAPEPKEDPKFAARFAALTRREQAIRAQEQAVKEREAKYKAREEEDRLLTENPLEFMARKGITFDKLTQLALNDGKKPAEMRVQELEERLEREKQERIEAEKLEAQSRYEAQKQTFLTEINEHLSANADSLELVLQSEEAPELIYSVIETHFQRTKKETGTGRILPVKDAAEMVEKHFEEILDSKYAKLKKVQSRFQPKETPAPAVNTAPAKPSATLTNTQATAVPTPSSKAVLSPEESLREASKLLKWT